MTCVWIRFEATLKDLFFRFTLIPKCHQFTPLCPLFCPQGCQGSLSHFPPTLGHSLLPIHCTSHELFGVVGMPREWALCPSTPPSKGVQFQGTTVNEAIPALAHRRRRHKTVTFPRAPPFALRTSPRCISGSFSKQFQVGPGFWQVKIGMSSTQFQ